MCHESAHCDKSVRYFLPETDNFFGFLETENGADAFRTHQTFQFVQEEMMEQQSLSASAKDDKHEIEPSDNDKLKDPKKTWDIVDEEGDESFPASDPPANY
ncbi:MAG: hypothetical protein CMK08_17360 [Ponticaulis sp.]|nr:hypothetical protein [Ponticaulis sp.]|tara:strand:- start:639 stop:941 length:303 start_codon:yes stop_codon:yes gene_type:complete